MLRRVLQRLGSTNRYTDGSGRRLDAMDLPKDLYLETISNRAYPVRGEHWQPVVANQATPHKGSVIVSGGGVVGMCVASQFSLRGWHTTVLEKYSSLLGVDAFSDAEYRKDIPSQRQIENANEKRIGPYTRIRHALVTLRAADALRTAGVALPDLRRMSVKVTGVLDHPGAFNSWLTRGLVENHPFAVNMLCTDMFALKQHLESHLAALPTGNCHMFHEHAIEAVFPLKQMLVVKPVSQLSHPLNNDDIDVHASTSGSDSNSGSNKDSTVPEKRVKRRKTETSLTLSSAKWEKKYLKDAVDYDLLVCAEGAKSHLRELLDVEGFASDVNFGVKWFVVRSSTLSTTHVHRWLHSPPGSARERFESLAARLGLRGRAEEAAALKSNDPYAFHVHSTEQVSMCIAFPRVEEGTFAMMAYFPMQELRTLSDVEFLEKYCPDAVDLSRGDSLYSFSSHVQPHPTVFCENLYNSVGLPAAAMVGDAAHACNPFWMQGLAIALEDGTNLINQVDAYSRHFYDAVKLYSTERGTNGDALREVTDRCLYYERKKHTNPFVRFQNRYQRFMNVAFPRFYNDMYSGSVNHVYSKSLETMMNGRGYTSYEYAEKQQAKHRAYSHLGRLYT